MCNCGNKATIQQVAQVMAMPSDGLDDSNSTLYEWLVQPPGMTRYTGASGRHYRVWTRTQSVRVAREDIQGFIDAGYIANPV